MTRMNGANRLKWHIHQDAPKLVRIDHRPHRDVAHHGCQFTWATLTTMRESIIGGAFKFGTVTLLFLLAGAHEAVCQEVSMALVESAPLQPTSATAPLVKTLPSNPVRPAAEEHKFWDAKNAALFATVAASSTADFSLTRDNLNHGGRELNPLTRPFAGSTTGLVANFAAETAGVIGVSYMFHRTGHHKLERLTPIVNFGMSAFAVSYGLAHR
jgi:hypothetical protein